MWKKYRKETERSRKEKEKEVRDFIPEEEKALEEVEQELADYLAEDHSKKKKIHKKWSKKKKRIVIGAGSVLFLMILFSMLGKKDPSVFVSPVSVERGPIESILSLSGPISGTESADVVSNLHAEVLKITVKEGDKVEKGQLLALIDSADVKKSVEMAQNAYDLAVSEYEESKRDTQNQYEKAVQEYDTARRNFERNQVLFQSGDISKVEFETIENGLSDARRAVEAFRIEKGKAIPDQSYELKMQSAWFELDKRKTELENTEVKSPISGTVVRVNSKVGQFADKPEDEKPMFTIENLEHLEMEISVSEYSIGKVKVGQKAQISADILDGKKAKGEITSISPTGEEKGNGSSERVIPATILIKGGKESGLIAGITAKASIVTEQAKEVLLVPLTSLIQDEDGNMSVAVINENTKKVHIVPVTLGIEGDLKAEISPIEEGAIEENMVVASVADGLAEGMTVTIR